MTIGKKLQERRKEMNLTQGEVAALDSCWSSVANEMGDLLLVVTFLFAGNCWRFFDKPVGGQ